MLQMPFIFTIRGIYIRWQEEKGKQRQVTSQN